MPDLTLGEGTHDHWVKQLNDFRLYFELKCVGGMIMVILLAYLQ